MTSHKESVCKGVTERRGVTYELAVISSVGGTVRTYSIWWGGCYDTLLIVADWKLTNDR